MEWLRFFTVYNSDNEMVGNYYKEVNAYKHRDMLVDARVGVHIFGLMDAEIESGEVEYKIHALEENSSPLPGWKSLDQIQHWRPNGSAGFKWE